MVSSSSNTGINPITSNKMANLGTPDTQPVAAISRLQLDRESADSLAAAPLLTFKQPSFLSSADSAC